MEPLKIYWLGQPLVEVGGRAVKLETRKSTALLSFLSLTPGQCQRELLATMFWPEGSQQKALASLRRTLSSLFEPARFIQVLSGSNRYIMSSMVEETLERQP